jgi:hypothetical protein
MYSKVPEFSIVEMFFLKESPDADAQKYRTQQVSPTGFVTGLRGAFCASNRLCVCKNKRHLTRGKPVLYLGISRVFL